jgi:hypothetical protein
MASLLGQTTPSGGWTDATGSSDNVEYILSTGIQFAVAGTINGVWFFVPTATLPTNPQFSIGAIKVNSGVTTSPSIVGNEAKTAPVSADQGTWKLYTFTTPVSVTASDKFLICVRTNRYAHKSNFFSADIVNGNLTAWLDNPNPFPNGCFKDTALGTNIGGVPTQSFNQTFYGIDVDFTASGGSTNATATPSLVAPPAVSVPTPTIKTGSTTTPALVAGVVSIPTPTILTAGNAKPTPATVAAVVSIPAPTIKTGSTAKPAMVAAVAHIGTPNINPVGAWSLWDNLHEIPVTLEGVWNGAINALTFDEVTQ